MTRFDSLAAGLLLLLSCSPKAPAPPASPAVRLVEQVGQGKVQVGSTSDPNRSLAAEPAPDCQRLECDGLLPGPAIKVLQERALRTRRCYEEALRKNPKLLGRVMVALRLDGSGQPCRASILQTELGQEPDFEACLLEVMSQPVGPLPSGCVDVNIPLVFVPREVETQAKDSGEPLPEASPEPRPAD